MEGNRFRVAMTRDFVDSEGRPYFDQDAWRSLQDEPRIDLEVLEAPEMGGDIPAEVVRAFDAVIMKRSPLSATALEGDDVRLLLVARNGVGFEHLDVAASTRAGVMITITPEAVRRPVASAIMTFILALAHRLPLRDRLTRAGRWSDRNLHPGIGLTGRVLGVIGVGNIGAEVFRLAAPWEMVHLGCDPSRPAEELGAMGVRAVDLDTLLGESDFVCLCCPLSKRTRHMIGAREFGLMKSTAYLINTARGGLIDEAALIAALAEGRIAGAGLDVLEREPPSPDNPLLGMENVILSSHNLNFNDEGNRLGNQSAAAAVLATVRGEIPDNLVNPDVLGHPRLQGLVVQSGEPRQPREV